MSIYDATFVDTELSKKTSIFGLRLWVVIGILVGSIIVLTLFLLSLCLTSRRQRRQKNPQANKTPVVSKEIQEIVHMPAPSQHPVPEIQVDFGKAEHRLVVFSDRVSSGESKGGATSACETTSSFGSGSIGPEVSHLGWGRWYTLRELEAATNNLCEENVIGEGGYGIVYHGVLGDGTRVAVKNLLNNKGQAEKEFKVEVEAIGRVRHKNLVRLLGYCVEGAYRMLVYEYVDNGNLEQWLHGDVGSVSPLSWDIRINIILGTAKGLAYLHEGLEPKVVHRDVKSSNILLNRQWNPKVSDFGLAKLLCSERSYVTTRVMGTFGYVAPEYACTGMLTEKSDVYSFGILIMEIITGRSPVDYSRPQGEVNLVEWLKTMVGNRKSEEVVDPKLPEMPSSKALKRALLVALRCVDPDGTKRPKMGHVIHMLEADDLLFRDERRIGGESSSSHRDLIQEHKDSNSDKKLVGRGTTDQSQEGHSRNQHQPTMWR
ncbi:probable serine/threonine-protein kinase At1g01540 [Prosopis cineraria]|uniref:probable serine/threonine-protein kinase At1g01540 n=1 Tax=Prosopis cineraria TaxID=364024 RepID=UPI00240F9325|nr:probable serine/threonine-protein kinase At1g01540 [Prosopis cineraria]XP_054779774.1 probable serine/threonine-protein kinase At1g01540 [Prosopis cineraria]XP_054779775.1 probable serine/threonine-protein kinase At1g01540 [Prosopis cineraria]XP_054779777.1 probable serine/threonine-protein kinase At1g01540 [Prosopis cineraria]XP_054779778.1 probable serine/threonine-protein kinase At1g01540 [Prosopis cineraria]